MEDVGRGVECEADVDTDAATRAEEVLVRLLLALVVVGLVDW